MRVILRKDVKGRGRSGDIVEVANGYARNYLIPQGYAVLANKGAVEQAKAMQRARAIKLEKEKVGALETADKLNTVELNIPVNASDEGKLFGSVTVADIAKNIQNETGIEIDKRDITLSAQIRALGEFQATINLHPEVDANIKINITPIKKDK